MFATLSLTLVLSAASGDEKKAEALFQQARALLKADQAAEACPLLAKSHQLDPALGTLMNLADCEERTKKLAAAYQHFNEVAAWAERTKETARENLARDRAAALKPKLSWLSLTAKAPVRGLAVQVNGVAVEPGGEPVPVDAGEATVTAAAETFKPFKKRVKVPPQSTVQLEVPPLQPVDAEPLKKPGDTPVAEVAPVPPPPPSLEPMPPPPMVKAAAQPAPSRLGPYTVMAGGGALLVAGVSALAWSFTTYSRFQNQQPGGVESAMPTVTRETFSTLQWMYPAAWVVTAVGALALAGGTTWLLLPTGNGAAFSARF